VVTIETPLQLPFRIEPGCGRHRTHRGLPREDRPHSRPDVNLAAGWSVPRTLSPVDRSRTRLLPSPVMVGHCPIIQHRLSAPERADGHIRTTSISRTNSVDVRRSGELVSPWRGRESEYVLCPASSCQVSSVRYVGTDRWIYRRGATCLACGRRPSPARIKRPAPDSKTAPTANAAVGSQEAVSSTARFAVPAWDPGGLEADAPDREVAGDSSN
jgi:hypothetical protein